MSCVLILMGSFRKAGNTAAQRMTCGYRPEKRAVTSLRRGCGATHSQLQYLGSRAARYLGCDTVFMDRGEEAHTRAFARELLQMLG